MKNAYFQRNKFANSVVEVAPYGQENPSRFGSVKKALEAAGFKVMSAAGFGYYGSQALFTDALPAQIEKALKSKSYRAEIVFKRPDGIIKL